MKRFVTGVGIIFLLSGCAATRDPSFARVEVVDLPNYKKELFRYIAWRGEEYGPHAFEVTARGKVRRLELVNPNPDSIRCIAALSGTLSVPAESIGKGTGTSSVIMSSSEPIREACSIPYDIPHPELPPTQYYVLTLSSGLAIEGEEPMEAKLFVRRLNDLGATGIVMRNPTIAELYCYGAVAGEAKVQLFDVNMDGSISTMSAGSTSTDDACNR